MSSKKVSDITHDGFPLESLPPKGTVTIKYDDGSKEVLKFQTRKDYDALKKKHGFK